jgi:hypothetical protein
VAARLGQRHREDMNLALAYQAPVAPRHDPVPHFNTYLLNVDFATGAADEWSAIGGGDSIPEAIAAAREALPAGLDWKLVSWNHLYGD